MTLTLNIEVAALTVGLVWSVLGMFATGVGNLVVPGVRSGAPLRDGVGLP